MLATSAWCMFLVALHFVPLRTQLDDRDRWTAVGLNTIGKIGLLLAIWWDMRQL
jgi:hypothetical protein